MPNNKFRELLAQKTPLIFDGAMGTVLMQKGFGHILAEKLNLENPAIIETIHREYVDAGVNIIETNTFNASALKLQELGLGDKLTEINTAAVNCAKRAAGSKALVAGSIGPTGKLLEPMGPLSFDAAYGSYLAQAQVLAQAGVDLFIIETISDIQEMRAALLAVKTTGLPVICSLTYNEDGRTLTGTDIYTAAVTLKELGADVLSINCSIGPEGVLKLYSQYGEKIGSLGVALMVMPNAGMPIIKDGKVVYTMTPDEYATIMDGFRQYGIQIYGGCCGTTPPHIAALAKKVKDQKITFTKTVFETYFTSRTKVVKLSESKPFLKIGEALNPTARKKFAEELKTGQDSFLREQAREQAKQGAHLLDLNVGVPELDQKVLMKKCIQTLTTISDLPLCLDSDDPEVLEAALKAYPGIALINSVNGKQKSMEKIIPLAKKYGACLIGLALDEKGIPEKAEGRIAIVENITKELAKYNYPVEKLFIDGLVMTVSSDPVGPLETLKVVSELTKKGIKTSLGVSNVSFGLPQRKVINNVFLALLAKAGLSAGIISVATFQEIANYSSAEQLAEDVILNKDPGAKKYIEFMNNNGGDNAPPRAPQEGQRRLPRSIYDAVVEGEEANILNMVEIELETKKPQEIIDKSLLPALDKVGEYYSNGKYYLPQMIASANTMKKAFNRLKVEFEKQGGAVVYKGTAVICTVEGDIHDIGKNIVGMMLENNGFKVIDLGKDVTADQIVNAVRENKANIVLLSALLTTTMLKMKEVKSALEAAGLNVPVMVGGAVVTSDFAQNFGAHYTADAATATQTVKKLLIKG